MENKVNFCIDCQFYQTNNTCTYYQKDEISLVDGKPMDLSVSARIERYSLNGCGNSGKFFKFKESKNDEV